MNDMQKGKKKSHAFSIILVMVVLMLVGSIILYTGGLTVQFNPVQENLNLSIGFSGSGSARVLETEVTSIIEGAMNTVDGVSNVQATTNAGNDTTPNGARIVKAFVPLAEQFGYVTVLRTLSSGRATSTMSFHHYAEVPPAMAKDIVERSGYRMLSDDE